MHTELQPLVAPRGSQLKTRGAEVPLAEFAIRRFLHSKLKNAERGEGSWFRGYNKIHALWKATRGAHEGDLLRGYPDNPRTLESDTQNARDGA